MHDLRALWQLQQLDLKLDEQLAQLRGAQAQLDEPDVLGEARAQVEASRTALDELSSQVRSWDLELRGLDERIKQGTERLYSGRVTNPKELAGLQQDLEYLGRSKDELEDQMLEAMSQVEERQPVLAAQQERLATIESDWQLEEQRLRALITELSASIQALQAERSELTAKIPQIDLVLYDELRRRRAGQAVALLMDRRCSACRVGVPSAKAQQVRGRTKLIQCDGCDRILVYLP